jgi:molybdopterin-guanine dinucleotide biosynthesis protein A
VVRGLSGFAQVVVTAKQPAKYALVASGAELVRDGHDAQTPLAGLAAGLAASRHELVFACAADMPFVADPDLLEALFAAVEGHDVAVAEREPLCALWRKKPALAVALELLRLPEPPGPRALWPRLLTMHLPWADRRPFLDADTPEVLLRLAEKRH